MTMLWYKAWLDTRWRFTIGFVLLVCGAALGVFGFPRVMRLIALQPTVDATSVVGRQVQEALALSREFRGYIWNQWFRQNALQNGTLFAILIGSGGILSHGGRGELYTLSLPVSRSRLLLARAALGLGELFVLTFVPALVIAAAAPAIGESYSVPAALVHATCQFAACAVLFSLALLLSTSYSDIWRPLGIAFAVAVVVGLVEQVALAVRPYGLFFLMVGERYFRTAHVPWLGLAAAAALSAAMIYGAAVNITRRDY